MYLYLPTGLSHLSAWRLTQLSAAIYPWTFVLSWLLYFFLHRFKQYIANNLVLSFLNDVFVQRLGYPLFTIAYLSHAVYCVGDVDNPRGRLVLLAFKFCIITLAGVIFHGSFISFLLVELVNKATGGHCEGPPEHVSMNQCLANANQVWVDGFDISSHYYFLLSLLVMLLNNAFLYYTRPSDIEEQHETPPDVIQKARKAVAYLSGFFLVIWYFEFVITSIFFHTIVEKFFGLIGVPMALVTIHISDKVFKLDTEAEEVET